MQQYQFIKEVEKWNPLSKEKCTYRYRKFDWSARESPSIAILI
jgi:hypothetical protein